MQRNAGQRIAGVAADEVQRRALAAVQQDRLFGNLGIEVPGQVAHQLRDPAVICGKHIQPNLILIQKCGQGQQARLGQARADAIQQFGDPRIGRWRIRVHRRQGGVAGWRGLIDGRCRVGQGGVGHGKRQQQIGGGKRRIRPLIGRKIGGRVSR